MGTFHCTYRKVNTANVVVVPLYKPEYDFANTTPTSAGGTILPAMLIELRFCEFAPESRAFFRLKNREIGFITLEVIWVCYACAPVNLVMPYTGWKTKNVKNKMHYHPLNKIQIFFIGLVEKAESR